MGKQFEKARCDRFRVISHRRFFQELLGSVICPKLANRNPERKWDGDRFLDASPMLDTRQRVLRNSNLSVSSSPCSKKGTVREHYKIVVVAAAIRTEHASLSPQAQVG